MFVKRAHWRWAVWLVVLFFAVAGCTGASDAATTTGSNNEPPPDPDPGPDPGTTVVLPADGATVTAPRIVSVSGADVERVRFEVDGTVIFDDEIVPFEWTFDPRSFSEGVHELAVDIRYLAGAQERIFVNVFLSPAPQGSDQPPEVFAAVANLQPGHWYEIPNTHLEEVAPAAGWTGVEGEPGGQTQNIMLSWSGGAFDTKRNRLIVWGGGHSGYAGNEVYVFDLNTLKWIRLTDPTPLPPDDPTNDARTSIWPDGRPVAFHSAAFLQYIPDPVDRFAILANWAPWKKGSSGIGDLRGTLVFYFDFDELEWEVASNEVPSYFESAFAAVHPNGTVWWRGGSGGDFASFDPVNRSWSIHQDGGPWLSAPYTGAIDAKNNRFLLIGSGHRADGTQSRGNGDLFAWDLENPAQDRVTLSTSGDKDIEGAYAPGFVYHPPSERMVAWDGGASVYTLDVDTLVWTKHATTGSVSPGPANRWGTWGRFRYVPSKDIFVVVNETDKNVFVYKLP